MHTLTLTLNLPLHPGDIPGFRAAIIELVDREQHLFHNHDNSQNEPNHHHFGYPLIQYQVRRGQATILGLNAGADAIKKYLLPQLQPQLHFAGRSHQVQGYQVQEREYALQLSERPQVFGLQGWLALNSENYAAWKSAEEGSAERLQILSSALTGHLRGLAVGLDAQNWQKLIEAKVLRVDNQKRIQWHRLELVRFDVLAESNLRFPSGIGVGRSAAHGFGEAMTENNYGIYRQWAERQLTTEDSW